MAETTTESFLDRLVGKRNAPLTIALLGVLLFLPLLGHFGLWDPYEVSIADRAKEVAASGGWALPNKPGLMRPPLPVWLVVAGFKIFGVGELGGRLPLALASIAALLACLYAGTGTIRRRGAWLGAVALASMPAFFLGARMLTSNVLPILGAALAVGGLARAAWPRDEEDASGMRLVHLGVGIVGLVIGHLSSGLLLGALVPIVAVAVALWAEGGRVFASLTTTLGALATLGIILYRLFDKVHAGVYSPILGGVPHASTSSVQLVTVLKHIGFGAFPWVVLLPLAAARALFTGPPTVPANTDVSVELQQRHERYGRLVLLVWVIVGYIATTLQAATVSEVLFPGLAAIALLVGDLLDSLHDEPERLGYAGFVAFVGAAILAHDFFGSPEHYVGSHILEGIKWPGPLVIAPFVILGLGVVWGMALALALAIAPSKGARSRDGRQGLLAITVGLGLLQALVCIYWIVPEVSQHLSYKGLFTKFQALGGGDGELGQYHVPGGGGEYYNRGKATDISTLGQLFEFLAKPTRAFVIVSAEDLAPIDQFAKSRPKSPTGAVESSVAPYYVIDDSNSRFLLLSNRLGPGDTDLNPLRRLIVSELPRKPQHEAHADFEGKVELVGYDIPAELERGHTFKVTLYYKVNAPVPAGYKVFVHFDGPGNRFNGDHVPLDGKFPTNYWVPGFYVIDEHQMEPDKSTVVSGWYQIYTGFWLGDSRLKAVSGQNDGENRVKIGSVKVK